MPYVIVTNGPTGSGKTGLIKKTIDNYNLDRDYEKFLIDDIIEQNEEYKSSIDKLIHKECKNGTLCPALRMKLLDPPEELQHEFQNLYTTFRKQKKCKSKDGNAMTCDDLLDSMLFDAIKRGTNIVFETVGTYYVSWLVDKLRGYDVYYAFTLLDFCENLRRNTTRAVEMTENFVNQRWKKGIPAPRLPDVSAHYFSGVIKQVHKNLESLIYLHKVGELPDVHRIIVFDNTNRDIKVLFDSQQEHSYDELAKHMHKIMSSTKHRSCYRMRLK